jgi:hypothetical protein
VDQKSESKDSSLKNGEKIGNRKTNRAYFFQKYPLKRKFTTKNRINNSKKYIFDGQTKISISNYGKRLNLPKK